MRTSILIFISMIVLIFVGTGCYEVEYTVEHKEGDTCIKFEDAKYYDEALDEMVDACLGDDEVEQADVFEVVVDSPVDVILVSLKAGGGKNGGKETDVPVLTDGITEVSIGSFLVVAGEIDEDPDDPEIFTYQIGVGSDDDNSTAALSYIKFCFGDATVLLPEEGPITILRYTELEEPGEPEEEEEIEID